ncbi:SDH family Clp fold serine proteinase, partial [Paeniglutamicibacter sp.]|uniref:SDH family Clp fold serine proteinase n=1 Tax=Paeniglutamicibacter sp. TaxID=1934391 RepID=UPI003988A26C
MPTWSELLAELQPGGKWADPATGNPDLDGMRRHWIAELSAYTKRHTVLYAADFLSPIKASSPDQAIGLSDMQGLMEVFKDLDVKVGLDLILHSPGGDPTAADSLVRYMRDRFSDVRVIVPIAAMSAATMWSLAADTIMMGQHSQLGPIDPQINIGAGMVPAGAIKRNFEKAQRECAQDPRMLSGWVPTLQQYFPGLLEMCDDYSNLSKVLVGQYLR